MVPDVSAGVFLKQTALSYQIEPSLEPSLEELTNKCTQLELENSRLK
jgi:hypothetical protein